MKILVGGSTGLVGGVLIKYLMASRVEILRLSRSPEPAGEPTVQWDPSAGLLPAAQLEGVDAVVHLAGENIAGGRWTARSSHHFPGTYLFPDGRGISQSAHLN